MLPDFRVLPWDYAGSNEAIAAHAVTHFPGQNERRVLLRVRQNALFFREENSEQTWACLHPLSINTRSAREREAQPDELIKRLYREFSSGNIGRVFLFRQQVSDFHRQESTVIATIRADGSGLCREFWDNYGLPFIKPEGVSLPPLEKWSQEFLESYMEHIWLRNGKYSDFYYAFCYRIVPEAVLRSEPLRFARGSLEDLGELARLLVWAWPDEWPGVRSWLYASNAPFGSARLLFIGANSSHLACPPHLQPLFDLILEENVGVGWDWTVTSNRELRRPTTRECCEVHNQLESGPISDVSAHETVEAQLFWREFLRNRWPHESIEALFLL